MNLERIPVTIITGYLGAGKTTLLRRIAEKADMRIAIVMNEFGEIAIDSRVVEGKNISIAELAGGCVCCSLSGEFGAAVSELIEKAKPEWIVVETTGVAEPAALAYDISNNMPLIRLDSIVTIVDADSMARFPSLGHTGCEQIELADILIVNKIDLVNKEALESVFEKIKKINNRAMIVHSERCGIDISILFGIERSAIAKKHRIHQMKCDYFDFVFDGALDHEGFLDFLEKMPEGIFRGKGFVRTSKGRFLVNFVAGRHSLEEFDCQKTELVFIGEGALSQKDLIISLLDSIRI